MRRICLLLLFLCAWPSWAEDEALPKLTDYAWGFQIDSQPGASFVEVALPLGVYQSVSDSALRDAGVFNAAGLPVPRLIRQSRDDRVETEQTRSLSAIALRQDGSHSADAVRLRFERDGDKTTVAFDTDFEPASAPLMAYIIDARPVKEGLDSLTLQWQGAEEGFIGQVKVEGSNDLQGWRPLGSGAVADMRQGSTSIVKREVALNGSRFDFLRLTPEALPTGWRLSAVEGQIVTDAIRSKRETIILDPKPEQDPADSGYVYDLGGAPPVDRLRVLLTDANTVISASLHYWRADAERWVQVASGPHYRVGSGASVIASGATLIDPVRAARFKLVVSRGQPGTPPRLEAGWRTETLLFLAQGEAPFTLAAGSAADAARGFPQQRLYGDPSIARLARQATVSRASLGPRIALGGTTDLRQRSPMDWRRLALWIGLIVGVLFVVVMALRVLRDGSH